MRAVSILSGFGLSGLLGCATTEYPPPPTYTLYAPPSVLVALPPAPKSLVDEDAKPNEKDRTKPKAGANDKTPEAPKLLPKEVGPNPGEKLPPPRMTEPDAPGGNIGENQPFPLDLKLPYSSQGQPLPRIDLNSSEPLTLPPEHDPGLSMPTVEVEPLQLPPASDPR